MKRLLVCEDEETIREFIVINLKRAGYDVVDVDIGSIRGMVPVDGTTVDGVDVLA